MAKPLPYNRDDRDLIIELKTESKNQTKVLDDHTSVLKSIERSLQDINEVFDKKFQDIEARKIDRTEINRLQSDAMNEHTKMQEDIGLLKDAHKEMLTTIKVFRLMISFMSVAVVGIAIPIISALISSHGL